MNKEKNIKASQWLGAALLLLTSIIWGLAFVAQSVGMDYVGPFTFNFSRFFVGAIVLLPFVTFNVAKKKTVRKDNIKITILGGVGCGIILFAASGLQQLGVMYTNAVGKAGFITALYIIIVPIIGFFFGKKSKALIWLCVILATLGLYLICVKEEFVFDKADIILTGCAFVFSLHIIFIDYVSPKTDGVVISLIQFFVAGVISLIVAVFTERISFANILNAYIPILYAGVMSCGVAYTLQIIGQKYLEPTKASLVMCLESVFATLGGFVILKEHMTVKELIGCGVVFIAIILAQFCGKKTEDNKETQKG